MKPTVQRALRRPVLREMVSPWTALEGSPEGLVTTVFSWLKISALHGSLPFLLWSFIACGNAYPALDADEKGK